MVAEGGTIAVSSAVAVSTAARPVSVRPQPAAVAPAAAGPRFLSPRVELDPASNLVVVQYRDSETGDVVRQYPSEAVVREYKRQQSAAPTADTAASPNPAEPPPPASGSGSDPQAPSLSGSHLSIDA